MSDPIDTIRGEIDRIDRTLLDLISKRVQLGDRLAALKESEPGLPMRPAREVKLLRALIAAAPQSPEPELIVEIWRALIAANLRQQRKIDVAVGGAPQDPKQLFDIARRHFGARTRIKYMPEPQAALQMAAENPENVVAVTPWPAAPGVGSWWPALTERRFRDLKLVAGLPLLGESEKAPDACVFAALKTLEGAGGDVSILICFDPHHRAQRALTEVGLAGREFARVEPRVLLRVEGFIGPDDLRLAAMKSPGQFEAPPHVLGTYARIDLRPPPQF